MAIGTKNSATEEAAMVVFTGDLGEYNVKLGTALCICIGRLQLPSSQR